MNNLNYLLKTIVIIIMTNIVISTTDYCEVERVSCKQKKHIACEDNMAINPLVENFTIKPITDMLKSIILNEFNRFRSNVAIGLYESEGLAKAANMRSIRWNDEFGHLAELSIKKLPYKDYSGCVNTGDFKAFESHHISTVQLNTEDLFRSLIQNQTINNNKKNRNNKYFNANKHQIGAAYGQLLDRNGNIKTIIKFIQNEWRVRSDEDFYEIGEPCNNCSMWDEICSQNEYPGLCVPKITTCVPSITIVEGKQKCRNDLIFEEHFENLSNQIWKPEIRIPLDSEDAEFLSYQSNSDNCYVHNGKLLIVPTLLIDSNGFDEERLRTGELNLNRQCTGIINRDLECKRRAEGQFILPPVVSCKLTTKDFFSFTYGKIEIRAKFPKGDWLFPQLQLEPLQHVYGSNFYKSGIMRVGFGRGNEILKTKERLRIDGSRLSGGLILAPGEFNRDVWMKKFIFNSHMGDNFHIYTLTWTNEIITVELDGMVYANYNSSFKHQADAHNISHASAWNDGGNMAPFDEKFYLSLGLGVGGISDFPDLCLNGINRTLKPWSNFSPKSELNFWQCKDDWYQTWKGLDAALTVDYVKVWAV